MTKTKLNIDEFFNKYLIEKTEDLIGYHYIFRFGNGYGAAVCKDLYSYGFDRDLWQLGVITWGEDGLWHFCDDPNIVDGVMGFLNNDEVTELLHIVHNLSSRELELTI